MQAELPVSGPVRQERAAAEWDGMPVPDGFEIAVGMVAAASSADVVVLEKLDMIVRKWDLASATVYQLAI